MEKIIELFLLICTGFGFVMICIVALSAISNFIDSFKRWNKERKEKKQKNLPEPLATLVSMDSNGDMFYITVKCPRGGNHYSTLIRHLDVSEYAAQFGTKEGK